MKPGTIDEYIAVFPADVQEALQKIRKIIHAAAPGISEVIKYDMPTFDLNGHHLMHLAAWQNHIALYSLPSGDADLQKEIAPYIGSKSTLQLPLNKPMPYDLIERVVARRVKEAR